MKMKISICYENQLKRYFPCRCEECGFFACSDIFLSETDYFGDSSGPDCPMCGSAEVDDNINNEQYIWVFIYWKIIYWLLKPKIRYGAWKFNRYIYRETKKLDKMIG